VQLTQSGLQRLEAIGRGLEKDECFLRLFHFPLPPIDRLDCGKNVDAGRALLFHKLPADALRRGRVGKSAEDEKSFVRHDSLGRDDRGVPANPAARHHDITFVADRGLAGSDGFLRFLQPNDCAIIGAGMKNGSAFLDGCSEFSP
jgi:hypothetical protein